MRRLSTLNNAIVVFLCCAVVEACAPGSLGGEADPRFFPDVSDPSSEDSRSEDSRGDLQNADSRSDAGSGDSSSDVGSDDSRTDLSGTDSSSDSGSGVPDADSNDCLPDACDPNATCTDLVNNFSCACNPGFIGDGFTCKSDGVSDCAADRNCILQGPVPDLWPTFHPKITHDLDVGTTHVWSFVYERQVVGQIGAVLSIGTKHIKISDVAADTAAAASDCWRDFGEYVYYEPATGVDQYKCNLVSGRQYYFNVKNVGTADTTYQLKGSGTEP